MRVRWLRCLLLSGLAAMSVGTAYAEGHDDTGNPLVDAPKPAAPKRKPVRKAATKPAAPKPALPAAPVPYNSYTAGAAPAASPAVAKALTPTYPTGTPVSLPTQPAASPPPPPPETQAPPITPPEAQPSTPIAPSPAAPVEISLKCTTRVTQGNRVVSQGSFFIDLFPSPVFPDQQADFKFMFVDPAHKSLIRESICLDAPCTADVSRTAYALVTRRTRHGDALRITLDRTNGAFYAERIDPGLSGTSHLGEQGWCTPQKIPSNPLF